MFPHRRSPTAPRSTIVRWVSLLALGYIGRSALLVRDYLVQSRGTPSAVSQSAPSPSVASR